MPISFKGNIDGIVLSNPINLPSIITSYKLVNKEGGTTTLNVYLVSGESEISIVPFNLELNEGDYAEDTNTNVIVQEGEQIKIDTNGSTDYIFTIENITP